MGPFAKTVPMSRHTVQETEQTYDRTNKPINRTNRHHNGREGINIELLFVTEPFYYPILVPSVPKKYVGAVLTNGSLYAPLYEKAFFPKANATRSNLPRSKQSGFMQ